MTTATLEEKPETAASTPATAAMANMHWRIPGDQIAKTCEHLPDDQRREIKWAAGYCRERNLSCEEFGGLLRQPGTDRGYSGDSVYQTLTGRREESSVERFCIAVSEFRKRTEETAPRTRTTFVETSLVRRIWATCRAAYIHQRISFIFGASQIGKTSAVSEYARRYNHGETVLVRMPTGGSLGDFYVEMGIRLGISTQARTRELRRRIIESFDSRTLLIVDECHECLSSHYSDRALRTLNFIREIWDRRKCGVVLVGTDVFRQGLLSNKTLHQLWFRRRRPLQLPARPSLANLADFALTFGLDPAPDRDMTVEVTGEDDEGSEKTERIKGNPLKLQEGIISGSGLGCWLGILEDAAELAREKSARMTWGRVIAAHHELRKLESPNP